MNPETKTPRTDAEEGTRDITGSFWKNEGVQNQNGIDVPADFARTLELELAQAKRECDNWKDIHTEEIGINLNLADRLGFADKLQAGMRYDEAEIEAFKQLKRELAEAKAELALAVNCVEDLKWKLKVQDHGQDCTCNSCHSVRAYDQFKRAAKGETK